ncbi:MAG: DUF2130 domain-containing protein [Sulfuricaulis sp.]
MTDAIITCPQCGTTIPVTEALAAQLRRQAEDSLRADYERRLGEVETRAKQAQAVELDDLRNQIGEQQRKVEDSAARELALRQQTRELEEQSKTIAAQVRTETEAALRLQTEQQIKVAVAAAEEQTRAQATTELKLLQQQLAEHAIKLEAANAAELELRRDKAALEQRQREMELEIQRKVDAQTHDLETRIRATVGDEQSLKLKAKDQQIESLNKLLEEARRKSEQGSQERQGEVLELDIQTALEHRFPQDVIRAVPKGVRGADLIQEVRNGGGQSCGSIIWELKNTKHWSSTWVDKLKDDQRASGAALAVIVSTALPTEIIHFGYIDGVWVASLAAWPALAGVLREQIIQVAFAHAASQGKQDKMDMLYRYLVGDEFRHRIEAIVEAFTSMQEQLQKERRAMERQWSEREKLITRVVTNTSGMYGDLQGIVGATLPAIPALELDGDVRLEHCEEPA